MMSKRLELLRLVSKNISHRKLSLTSAKMSHDKSNSRNRIADMLFEKDEQPQLAIIPEPNKDEPPYVTFNDYISKAKHSAKCSVLVQVKSEESADDLLSYCCTNFGKPKSLYYHKNTNNPGFESFFVVEFDSPDITNEIVQNFAKHRTDAKGYFPVCSPFLWLSQGDSLSRKVSTKRLNVPLYLPKDAAHLHDNRELANLLQTKSTVHGQMQTLFDSYKMTAASEKIRFLACEQVEMCLRGIFPRTKIMPFGSSVNSFGKQNCDLDLAIMHDSPPEKDSRLVFHSKGSNGHRHANDEKTVLSFVSYAIQQFLPGCKVMDQVYNARVPIVKYRQDFLQLECDVAIGRSGYEASSLLYLWGNIDHRVRPLVFAVRKWAKEHGLAPSERPTQSFTNFPLTLMVVFFLQYQHGILPSLQKLRSLSSVDDHVICDGNADATFLRDINGLRYGLTNSSQEVADLSLFDLLQGFFQFYGLYDYQKNGICVIEGQPVKKRRDALDIVNPLQSNLNCSSFVSLDTLIRFRKMCHQTCKKIQHLETLQEKGEELDPKYGGKLMYLLQPNMESVQPTNTQTDENQTKKVRSIKERRQLRIPGAREIFQID